MVAKLMSIIVSCFLGRMTLWILRMTTLLASCAEMVVLHEKMRPLGHKMTVL